MNVILYANRNTGMVALLWLIARGYNIKVITEDDLIRDLSYQFNLEVVDFETMGEFDVFVCCHGQKIIPKKYLVDGKFFNIHPCLFKYKGHNPIKRYIDNEDMIGSVEIQFMEEEVDSGMVIDRYEFNTPICTTYAEFYNIALPYYIKCLEAIL
jgi:methionyl-tRNA formyltransferase